MKRTYLAITLTIATAIIFSVYLYTVNTRYQFVRITSSNYPLRVDRITGRIWFLKDIGKLPGWSFSVEHTIQQGFILILITLNIWAWRKVLKKKDSTGIK